MHKAINVSDLELHIHGPDGFPGMEDISWVTGLTRLQRMYLLIPLAVAEDTVLGLFRQINGPLEAISIQEMTDIDALLALEEGPFPWSNRSTTYPLAELARFSETLREISFDWNNANVGLGMSLASQKLVFPVMRKVHWCSREPIDTGALVSAFPNLQDLSVCCTCAHEPDDAPGQSMGYNVEAQRRQNQEIQRTRRWSSLRTLRGHGRCLYMLGLVCPVEHVDIADDWTPVNEKYLQEVLSAAQPTQVEFHMICFRDYVPNLAQLLPIKSLEEIVLHLLVRVVSVTEDEYEVLKGVITAMVGLPHVL